ncbi:MAG: archease [Gemmatimonadales bacterium]
MTYQFVPHTADIKAVVTAADLPSLYRDATGLVRELLVGGSPVSPLEIRTIAVPGGDPAHALFHYLRELLYRFDTERFVPHSCELRETTSGAFAARVRGERFDASRHEAQPEVKAVTRHGLVVERTEAGWRAQVLFDV